jgi:hypothetical protein
MQYVQESQEMEEPLYDSPDWPAWEEEAEDNAESEEAEEGVREGVGEGAGAETEEETEEEAGEEAGEPEALPNPNKTRQLPIQTKRKAKRQQPTHKSTAPSPAPAQAPQTSKKKKKQKHPTSSSVRVVWNDTMCEILLDELINLIRKGKASDNGFKEALWGEIAEVVRPYYVGNAPFNGKKCKTKYEGYKLVWSAWVFHLGHISG